MTVVKLGIVYFALVFAVGFALGVVRVSWLVPSLGERNAELIETPFMLGAIVLAARYVIGRWGRALSGTQLALGGAVALGLLVTRRAGRKTAIPFGPALVAGTFVALAFGDALVDWYLGA